MAHAIWTPLAELEVEDILYYIRIVDGRPETSRRIGEELRDCADRQAAHNLPGHRHSSAPDGWLYVKHKPWLIFYQPHRDGIEVMRVVDAVRDLPSLLP
jgi:plasmid stabilization system protein ParE